MSRRIQCEHDKVFSGHLRHGVYAWICRACGSCGWSADYEIARVSLEEYHAVRVLHGWATPVKIPLPPRVPVIEQPGPVGKARSLFLPAMLLHAFMVPLIGVLGLPLGSHGESVLPVWMALIGMGWTLMIFTLCYVAWKKGF